MAGEEMEKRPENGIEAGSSREIFYGKRTY